MIAKFIAIAAFVCVAQCFSLNDISKALEAEPRFAGLNQEIARRSNFESLSAKSIEERIKEVLRIKAEKEKKVDEMARELIRESESGKLSDEVIGARWNAIEKMRKDIDREAQHAIEEITKDVKPKFESKMETAEEMKQEMNNKMNKNVESDVFEQVRRELEGADKKNIRFEAREEKPEIYKIEDVAEAVRRQFEDKEALMAKDTKESKYVKAAEDLAINFAVEKNEINDMLAEIRFELENEAREATRVIFTKVERLVRDNIFKNEEPKVVDMLLKEVREEIEHEAVHVVDDVIHNVEHIVYDIVTKATGEDNTEDVISKVILSRMHPEMIQY